MRFLRYCCCTLVLLLQCCAVYGLFMQTNAANDQYWAALSLRLRVRRYDASAIVAAKSLQRRLHHCLPWPSVLHALAYGSAATVVLATRSRRRGHDTTVLIKSLVWMAAGSATPLEELIDRAA